MPWHVSLNYDTYEEAHEKFAWNIPDDYNAAYDFLRKHKNPDSPALFQAYPDGRRKSYSFADLDRLSNQFAHALVELGVERGDRVAVVLPQKPANPVAHLACWKLGAVSVPLSILFGNEGLRYRIANSGARIAVIDESIRDTLKTVRDDLSNLENVVEVDGDARGDAYDFETMLAGRPTKHDIAETTGDDVCILIYTSGSTGPPKGVVHTHDVWLGHLPAYRLYFERDLAESTMWTPADWAWIGALGDLVFPAWHYGRPVVGYPMGKFDPKVAFELCEEFDVTDAFLPPTAIRMMMGVENPTEKYELSLKAICSGGEPITPEIMEWARKQLEGVALNELYGQTEANIFVTNCHSWFDPRPGSMGKPAPGHDVTVIDTDTGESLPPGEIGQIAIRHGDDPVIFEEYWQNPEKTAACRLGDWHLTGDLGSYDEDGYYWFKSRDDDVILTAGYRVGPGEVERAILEHPDVEQVGVIGTPDETRGEIIKAFVQPVQGTTGDDALRAEIQDLVRDRLAKYEYPRKIEFVEELPQTTTGKIQRKALRDR